MKAMMMELENVAPHPSAQQQLLSLMGQIEIRLGSQAQETEAAMRRAFFDARKAETPRRMRIHGQVVADANGFGVIAFDNVPSQGWFWLVRKLAIGGATPATAAAGRADIFVSSMDYRQFTDLAQCGTQDWLDQAASLPLVGDFSPGELPIQFQEKLFVVISGGTAAQTYLAAGVIEAWQEAAYRTDWNA